MPFIATSTYNVQNETLYKWPGPAAQIVNLRVPCKTPRNNHGSRKFCSKAG